MIKILLFLFIIAHTVNASQGHRQCYACLSRDDCAIFGTHRIENCDRSAHCYTVVDSMGVELKGCSNKCEFMKHQSTQRHCHTCVGDLCNSQLSTVNLNNFPNGGVVGQVAYDPYSNGGRNGNPKIIIVKKSSPSIRSLLSLIPLTIFYLFTIY